MNRRIHVLLLAIAALALALRLAELDDLPPGFYRDECSVGANAWSVAVTGHDLFETEHPLLFRALEDWKHPLSVYGAVASVRALGPTKFAVRLPAAVFGTLAVWLVGLLAFELSNDPRVAVAASLVLALTPWHIQFSRLAWGGPEAFTFPILLALWLYFLARRRRSTPLFALSGAAFALELYSYAPAKLIVPAFLVVILVIEMREAKYVHFIAERVTRQHESAPRPLILLEPNPAPVPTVAVRRGQAWMLALVFAACAAPLVLYQAQHFAEIQTRFDAISVFNRAAAPDGPVKTAVRSYLAHLNPVFLFVSGDANPRHSWKGWGELLIVTAPFCVLALLRLGRRREPEDLLLLAWIAIYPLGAFLTARDVPHAARALLGAPLFAILAGHGLALALDRAATRSACIAVTAVALAALLGNAGLALYDFGTRYPREAAAAFNDGAEDLVRALEKKRGELKGVHFAQEAEIVRDDVLFFSRFDPTKFDPSKPDPYYTWIPANTSLPRFLKDLPRNQVLVYRAGREFQLGIPPDETFLDRTGAHGFAVYRGLK
jgi:4-amino-4-deoxy-L-arabinose transferase-like glycosyltransferase